MAWATPYAKNVIGTRGGGRLIPIAVATAGWNAALIERDLLGGTSVNVGCTRTQTMVASARVASLAQCGADDGVHTGPIAAVMPAVRTRRQRTRRLIAHAQRPQEKLIKQEKGVKCHG